LALNVNGQQDNLSIYLQSISPSNGGISEGGQGSAMRPGGGSEGDEEEQPGKAHSNNVHRIHMRGLPFQATENDINEVLSLNSTPDLTSFLSLSFFIVFQSSHPYQHQINQGQNGKVVRQG